MKIHETCSVISHNFTATLRRFTSRLFGLKKNSVICTSIILNVLVSASANEPIVIDDAFYAENTYIVPPRLVKRTDVDNYYEIQIAPADENGVSHNWFQKIDATNLDGLLLINNPDPDPTGSVGNQNLRFSRTADLKAKEIYIKITNPDVSSETFLHGLIQVIGDRANVTMESDSSVSINGAFFRNIENFYVKSNNGGTIHVDALGIHADSPVIFDSKYVNINGPIRIPGKKLFFVAQGACTFSENGSIEELGGLEAVCSESFSNQGNIQVQGQIAIEAGIFTNQALWDHNIPWTLEMTNGVDPKFNAGKKPGPMRAVPDNAWPLIVPFPSLEGRTYDKKRAGSGTMSAKNYYINVTKTDFLNIDGAELSAYGLSPERSQIYVNGKLLNQYYKAFNQQGFSKEGFDFIPSKINLRGDAIFHSETKEIINSASTINVQGNCTAEAAIDIIGTNAQGSYFSHYEIHKNAGCCGNQIYTQVNVPAFFIVHGQEASRVAGGGIFERASLYATKGNNFDKHVGKHIIQAVAIDPVSEQKAMERVNDLFVGNQENALIQKFGSTAVGSPSWSWGRIGGNYIGGLSTIDTEGGLEILDGAEYKAKGLALKSRHDVNLIGVGESYIDQIINNKNERMITNAFRMHPSIMEIDGPFKIIITEGSLNLNAAIIVFAGDGTIDAPKMSLVPLTLLAEDFYYKKKQNFFNTGEITIRKSTAATMRSEVLGGGHLQLNIGHLINEGSITEGKLGTEYNVDKLELRAHIINKYLITNTKSHGILGFPGITNALIDLGNGDFSSKSITGNIPIAGALDRVFKTRSASDMAPSVSALIEAYTMADQFSRTYQATGSEMAAMTTVALDQLGLTMVGGVPVPSSISFGTKKTKSKSTWQTAIPAEVGGAYVKINAREVYANGAIFKADKDIDLTVKENLYLHAQPLESSEKFREEGKFLTLSFSTNSVSATVGGNLAKQNSHTIHQALSQIIAGGSVNIEVGENAEVEGVIRAPKVKVKVAGELLLKTLQDKGEGTSSQISGNVGASISSAGVTPSGGFRYGNGDWFRNWANQQTGIFGTEVEVDVKKLILDGAAILAKMGYVNAESIEHMDLQNIYKSEFSEFGYDTNFVTFLIDPVNAQRVVAAANAIKGMAVFGNEDESAYQTLFATISQNLNVNTNSNIDGLNRDDSKAEGPVHKSSHKFSLALPVIDFKELGEGLQRIGMTARDINQKMQGNFENAKQQATAPEEKANIEEVQAKYNDIVEKIEKSDLPEDKKVEITMRIALLFTENEPDSGQYLIQEKPISELSEKGKFTPIRLGDDDQWDSTYSPNGGAILAIEISVSYGEDTYKYMAQYFDAATISDLRQTQSKWTKFMKDYGPGAIDFCEGFAMAPVETLLAVKDGFVMIGGLYIDITDGTFAKDSEAFRSLGWEDQLKIIDHVAAEMLQEMYKGVRESLESPKGWGGIAGDIAMGAGALKFAKVGKAGSKFDGKSAVLEETCPRVIGLAEREVSMAKNPLKLKQTPASTAIKLEEIRHLPPLRQEYIKEVWELKRTAHKLYKKGKTSEEIARTVSQMRRDLGIKYKDMTPPELREIIYKSNIEEYGDPLGPTIEYLRNKKGKSWEEIIESACKEGGRDLPGTK